MKRLFSIFGVIFLMLFLFVPNVIGAFTVTWDENVPAPDGYAVYARFEGEQYDYDNPIWEGELPPTSVLEVLPSMPDILPATVNSISWNKTDKNIIINWSQSEPLSNTKTVYLVCRAFLNDLDPTDDVPRPESPDSEEVSIDQTSINNLTKWEIFYSDTAGGPYQSLGTIDAGEETTYMDPITSVPDGQAKRTYFTLVSFGQEGTFSPNSEEVSVIIDKRKLPTPPLGVSVTAIIPVQ